MSSQNFLCSSRLTSEQERTPRRLGINIAAVVLLMIFVTCTGGVTSQARVVAPGTLDIFETDTTDNIAEIPFAYDLNQAGENPGIIYEVVPDTASLEDFDTQNTTLLYDGVNPSGTFGNARVLVPITGDNEIEGRERFIVNLNSDYITDGGFEQDLAYWQALGVATDRVEVRDDQLYIGSFARVGQDLELEPSTSYRVAFDISSQPGATTDQRVDLTINRGSLDPSNFGMTTPRLAAGSAPNFETRSFIFNSGRRGNNFNINFEVEGATAPGNPGVVIDNVSIVPTGWEDSTTVTILNDDVPGFAVDNEAGPLLVTEGSSTGVFQVVLLERPSSNVVVNVSFANPNLVTVDTSTVTFTPDNWSTPQAITVTPVPDEGIRDDSTDAYFNIEQALSDDNFDSLPTIFRSVSVLDPDVAGLALSTNTVTLAEDGQSTEVSIALTAQPSSIVRPSLASTNPEEVAVSPTDFAFTRDNWNIPQTITLTALPDTVISTDTAVIDISVAADPGDAPFGELRQTIVVTILDDDIDTDADSVTDERETLENTDPSNPNDYQDSDADGYPDALEESVESDTADAQSTPADTDTDGVPDAVELLQGTDPADNTDYQDVDADGYADYLEVIGSSNPRDAESVPVDTDNDQVPDAIEILQNTDLNNGSSFQDTDGDGISDFQEIITADDLTDDLDTSDPSTQVSDGPSPAGSGDSSQPVTLIRTGGAY